MVHLHRAVVGALMGSASMASYLANFASSPTTSQCTAGEAFCNMVAICMSVLSPGTHYTLVPGLLPTGSQVAAHCSNVQQLLVQLLDSFDKLRARALELGLSPEGQCSREGSAGVAERMVVDMGGVPEQLQSLGGASSAGFEASQSLPVSQSGGAAIAKEAALGSELTKLMTALRIAPPTSAQSMATGAMEASAAAAPAAPSAGMLGGQSSARAETLSSRSGAPAVGGASTSCAPSESTGATAAHRPATEPGPEAMLGQRGHVSGIVAQYNQQPAPGPPLRRHGMVTLLQEAVPEEDAVLAAPSPEDALMCPASGAVAGQTVPVEADELDSFKARLQFWKDLSNNTVAVPSSVLQQRGGAAASSAGSEESHGHLLLRFPTHQGFVLRPTSVPFTPNINPTNPTCSSETTLLTTRKAASKPALPMHHSSNSWQCIILQNMHSLAAAPTLAYVRSVLASHTAHPLLNSGPPGPTQVSSQASPA